MTASGSVLDPAKNTTGSGDSGDGRGDGGGGAGSGSGGGAVNRGHAGSSVRRGGVCDSTSGNAQRGNQRGLCTAAGPTSITQPWATSETREVQEPVVTPEAQKPSPS